MQPDETHLGLLKWKRGLLYSVPKGAKGGGDDGAGAAAADGDGEEASGEETETGEEGAAAVKPKMRGPKKSGIYWYCAGLLGSALLHATSWGLGFRAYSLRFTVGRKPCSLAR